MTDTEIQYLIDNNLPIPSDDPDLLRCLKEHEERLEILKQVFKPMSPIIKWLYFRNVDIYD